MRVKKVVSVVAVVMCSLLMLVGCGSSSKSNGTYSYYEENQVTYGDAEYTSYQYVNLVLDGEQYTVQLMSSTGSNLEGGSFAGRWVKGNYSVEGNVVTCEAPTSVGSMDIELSDDGKLVVAEEPNEMELDMSEFRFPQGTWYNDDFSSKWEINTEDNTCVPVK